MLPSGNREINAGHGRGRKRRGNLLTQKGVQIDGETREGRGSLIVMFSNLRQNKQTRKQENGIIEEGKKQIVFIDSSLLEDLLKFKRRNICVEILPRSLLQ